MEGFDAEFRPGEVHAVVGENGAGKSTLVGMLAGFVTPSSGSITLDGVLLATGRPDAAREAGIALVHQHFTLVPAMDAAENLALPALKGWWSSGDATLLSSAARAAADRLGWSVPDRGLATGRLGVGEAGRLELLKALATGATHLLLDEPTAVLSEEEAGKLLALARGLADEGRSVILIAHKPDEVLYVADRITVLRRGRMVATGRRDEFDRERLVREIVGEFVPFQRPAPRALGPVVLSLRHAVVMGSRGEERIPALDLVVAGGEIVGVGGVDGNGQAELAEAAAGVRPLASGARQTAGEPAYIPQDRWARGLAAPMDMAENMLLGPREAVSFFRRGWLSRRALSEAAEAARVAYDVRMGSIRAAVGRLSGGNAQKVVLARALFGEPDVVVAHNPTRGLDVRAAQAIHEKLVAARDRGAAILLVTTDAEELRLLSDRAFAMDRGRLVPL